MYTEQAIIDRTFRPQLKKYEPNDNGEYPQARYAHWKRDGHMVRFEVDIRANHWSKDGNTWSAWTRRPTDISWDIHDCWIRLNEFLQGLQQFGKSVHGSPTFGKWILLGEMFYPDFPASYMKTGLSKGDKALEIEFFAILSAPGYALTELYDMPLQEAAYIAELAGFPFVPFYVLSGKQSFPKEHFDYAKQATRDIEGFVYKDGNLKHWYRWKDKNTIDLIVTDFTLGEGKYAGQVGSLVVSTTEGHEVASISGMTDDERKEMTNAGLLGTLQGRVCEVEYQLVGSKGRLRHPQFKRWREDKDARDCSITQDPDLERVWNATRR